MKRCYLPYDRVLPFHAMGVGQGSARSSRCYEVSYTLVWDVSPGHVYDTITCLGHACNQGWRCVPRVWNSGDPADGRPGLVHGGGVHFHAVSATLLGKGVGLSP